MEKLLQIACDILSANDKALLSGSLALRLQKIPTRRESKDIDIVFEGGISEFKKIDGVALRKSTGDNEEYDNDFYERRGFSVNGVDVDVFFPVDEDVKKLKTTQYRGNSKPIELVEFSEILKFKIQHSFGEHFSRYKHRQDIIHTLVNI